MTKESKLEKKTKKRKLRRHGKTINVYTLALNARQVRYGPGLMSQEEILEDLIRNPQKYYKKGSHIYD